MTIGHPATLHGVVFDILGARTRDRGCSLMTALATRRCGGEPRLLQCGSHDSEILPTPRSRLLRLASTTAPQTSVNGSGTKSQKVFKFLELRHACGNLVPPALAFSGENV
jgi:hypothetical protein